MVVFRHFNAEMLLIVPLIDKIIFKWVDGANNNVVGQPFEKIHVKIMFIWKAVGGKVAQLRRFARLLVSQRRGKLQKYHQPCNHNSHIHGKYARLEFFFKLRAITEYGPQNWCSCTIDCWVVVMCTDVLQRAAGVSRRLVSSVLALTGPKRSTNRAAFLSYK